MRKILDKKVKGIPVALIIFFAVVGVAIAAYLYMAKSKKNILGVKSKFLKISTDNRETWASEVPAFFDDEEYDLSLGDKTYIQEFNLKTSKNGLTEVDVYIDNIIRTEYGGYYFFDRPTDPADDILSFYTLWDFTGEPVEVGTLRDIAATEGGSAYTIDFIDVSPADKEADDTYEFRIVVNSEALLLNELLQGSNGEWDLIFEAVE